MIRSPSVAMINVVSGTKLILAEKRAVPGEGIVSPVVAIALLVVRKWKGIKSRSYAD